MLADGGAPPISAMPAGAGMGSIASEGRRMTVLQKKSRTILGFSRAQWFLSALFAIYMFEYMVTLTFIDQRSAAIADLSWQLYLHYIDYALVALGFVSFALLRRAPERFSFRRTLLLLPSIAYGCAILLLFFLQNEAAFSAAAMAAAYFLGLLGGMVYFCMAAALKDSPKMGRVMALGASAAVLLQYLLQEYWHISSGIPAALVLGFFAAVYLAVRRPWEWLTEDYLPHEAPKAKTTRGMTGILVRLCLNTLCLYAIGAIYDRQMLLLNVQSGYEDYNLYAWPRLFLIAGFLLVGILSDVGRGKLLSVATLCVVLVALLNPVLFGDPAYYATNMCLFYLCLGACLSYYNLAFWRMAPQTGWPELWAGMGRITTNLFSALLTLVPVGTLSMTAAIGIDAALFGVLVVSMAAGGELTLTRQAQPETPEQALAQFCQSCHLTPRESEVLQKLLESEDSLQVIAADLAISVRMVQRYVTSIYEKTGAKSRTGLHQRYTQHMLKNR